MSVADNKVVRATAFVCVGAPDRVLQMLATWPHPTRLETRTKESNTYASRRVVNPQCAMKVNRMEGVRPHIQPTLRFFDGFE
jgi:hypothetical protein